MDPYPELKAVLFDLDETLTDRRSSITKMCARFSQRFSRQLAHVRSDDLYRQIITNDRGGYRPKEEFFAALERELPWSGAERPTVVELTEFWQAEFPNCTVAREHAAETLALLRDRGLRLGLVTNGRTAMQNAKIDALNVRGYFSSIAISEAVGTKKPDPKIFFHVLEALGVGPREAAFVGDHPVNDIAAAQALGMKAIWLRGPQEWPTTEPPPRYSVDTLKGIMDLLS